MSEKPRYSLNEWLRLQPAVDYLKQFRNAFLLNRYLRCAAGEERAFLARYAALRGENILIIVAFEQPLALGWMLSSIQRWLTGCTVLVFDNSRNLEMRQEIRQVCSDWGVGYLALPENSMRHPNRSHGMAMTWIYHRIVKQIQPGFFGYADHDMILGRGLDMGARMAGKKCFGVLNQGSSSWNLWAGYCVFSFPAVKNLKLNFFNDFSRNLDTGGRNWSIFYKTVGAAEVGFAPRLEQAVINPLSGEHRQVEIIDESWMHIGSISYNDNFRGKRQFFSEIFHALNAGVVWPDLFPGSAGKTAR